MLEPPDLPAEAIVGCLRQAYGIDAAQATFLPLGADEHTAVYRVVTASGPCYFLKLRRGAFDATPVTLTNYLAGQGIRAVIPPLATTIGRLWADMGEFSAILYPFVEGSDGFAVTLTPQQWAEFGAALRRVHSLTLPPALAGQIRCETYSPRWRNALRHAMARLDAAVDDPAARHLAALLVEKRGEIALMLERAGSLAQTLLADPRPNVLCHSDVHAGNVLVDRTGALYIVDWDEPIYAPKERDLMFPGGAQGFIGHSPAEEEALFYQGYGPTYGDRPALAYYRYERIVTDLAIFCEQLLFTTEGGGDRPQWLGWARANFAPGGTLEAACRVDGGAVPG